MYGQKISAQKMGRKRFLIRKRGFMAWEKGCRIKEEEDAH